MKNSKLDYLLIRNLELIKEIFCAPTLASYTTEYDKNGR